MISEDVYAEVFEILSYMNKSVVMKIPMEILENINKKRDRNYISRIDKNDIFNTNNIKYDTVKVLAWLDVNYWMNNDKKEKLKKKAIERNISKYTMEKQDIFKNKSRNNKVDYHDSLIEIKKYSLFKEIIKLIKRIFGK